MIFERMCNLFVAAMILIFIVLSQITCASIHVYGFEVKENVVEYEKNLTLCSVRNRMIKEVSNPDALSRKTLVAETFEALIFREGTMFEVRYSPQKNENSFLLQDEDIVFFQTTSNALYYLQSREFLSNRIVNVYPLYEPIAYLHLNTLSAHMMSDDDKKTFPVQELYCFYAKIIDYYKGALRAKTTSRFFLAQRKKMLIAYLIRNELSNSIIDYKIEIITPQTARLIHKVSGKVTCMYVYDNTLNQSDSDSFLSPSSHAYKFYFSLCIDVVKDEAKRLDLAFIPSGEMCLPCLDYIAMRLYLNDSEELICIAEHNSEIYALVKSDEGIAVYRLLKDCLFKYDITDICSLSWNSR